MTSTVYNTFSYDVEAALLAVAQTYIANALDWASVINYAHGQDPDKIKLPRVVVYTADPVTEEVFRTGIFRAKLSITMGVDLDVGTSEQIKELSAAIQDIWELDDLETEITNTGIVVAKLVLPGETNPIELVDRYAERTTSGEIIGYSVAGE